MVMVLLLTIVAKPELDALVLDVEEAEAAELPPALEPAEAELPEETV
jgi:hypothetical protein